MQTGKAYRGLTKNGAKIRYTVEKYLTTATFEPENDDGVEGAGDKPTRKIEVGVSKQGNFVTREVTYGEEKVVVLNHHPDKATLLASLDPADSLTAELIDNLADPPPVVDEFAEFTEV
jgi:hypothetical protein